MIIPILIAGVIAFALAPLAFLLWALGHAPNCPGDHVTLKRLSDSVHEWRCVKCGDSGVIDDAGLDGGSLLHSCGPLSS